jgi:hypothetical protein
MNSNQATNALNDLVSYRNQFDPQDWKDYLYDEAVSFQRQTTAKNPVDFLPEIWGLIKQFLIPYEEELEAEKVLSAFLTPPKRRTPAPIRDELFTKTRVLLDNEYYENVLEPSAMPYYKDAYLSKIFNNDLEDSVECYRIELCNGGRCEYDCLYVIDAYLKGVSIQIPVYITNISTSSGIAMRHSVEGDYDYEDEETVSLSEIFKTLPVRTYEPLLKQLFRYSTPYNCW